jgi:quercetin dioxygenase-like cupin family protein
MKLNAMFFAAAILGVAAEGAFAQDPASLSPKMYTILLENDQVRVLEFHCTPGEKEPMHSHPALVAYSLTTSKFKATTRDGQTTEGEAKAGTAVWSDAVTHSWECLGSEQRTIITELKGVKTVSQE